MNNLNLHSLSGTVLYFTHDICDRVDAVVPPRLQAIIAVASTALVGVAAVYSLIGAIKKGTAYIFSVISKAPKSENPRNVDIKQQEETRIRAVGKTVHFQTPPKERERRSIPLISSTTEPNRLVEKLEEEKNEWIALNKRFEITNKQWRWPSIRVLSLKEASEGLILVGNHISSYCLDSEQSQNEPSVLVSTDGFLQYGLFVKGDLREGILIKDNAIFWGTFKDGLLDGKGTVCKINNNDALTFYNGTFTKGKVGLFTSNPPEQVNDRKLEDIKEKTRKIKKRQELAKTQNHEVLRALSVGKQKTHIGQWNKDDFDHSSNGAVILSNGDILVGNFINGRLESSKERPVCTSVLVQDGIVQRGKFEKGVLIEGISITNDTLTIGSFKDGRLLKGSIYVRLDTKEMIRLP